MAQQPRPTPTRRDELKAVITELEKQYREAQTAADNPDLDAAELDKQINTMKGLGILLAAAEAELAELD